MFSSLGLANFPLMVRFWAIYLSIKEKVFEVKFLGRIIC